MSVLDTYFVWFSFPGFSVVGSLCPKLFMLLIGHLVSDMSITRQDRLPLSVTAGDWPCLYWICFYWISFPWIFSDWHFMPQLTHDSDWSLKSVIFRLPDRIGWLCQWQLVIGRVA